MILYAQNFKKCFYLLQYSVLSGVATGFKSTACWKHFREAVCFH